MSLLVKHVMAMEGRAAAAQMRQRRAGRLEMRADRGLELGSVCARGEGAGSGVKVHACAGQQQCKGKVQKGRARQGCCIGWAGMESGALF